MKKRTPRNYRGTQSPAKRLGDLLPDWMGELSQRRGDPREELFAFWGELLGEKMAPLTEPISYLEGVLTIKVKSSTLYSLLCQHERPRLLKRLQEKFPVRNLVFRIG